MRKVQNGITLIALVITIIVLLILAGISIQTLKSSGLFQKAKEAKNASENAELEQQTRLSEYENALDEYYKPSTSTKPEVKLVADNVNKVLSTTDNTELKDEYGNKITVPAGFKIKVDSSTNNATTVNQGIVIVDSNENEFVWIPVGKIYIGVTKTPANTKTIELGRYDFGLYGGVSAYSGSYVEEDTNDESTLKNIKNKAIAKSITNFKTSVEKNGGYYIGRYESRTTTARTNESDTITPITEKGTDKVYNYVTQLQAAQLAQNMYNSDKFTSDLMNSYAWDTATLFLQTCGTNTTYSRQTSVNTTLSQTGTNTQETKDVQCNVYDMASNIWEWTTETSESFSDPCVIRGGHYLNNTNSYTSYRMFKLTSCSYDNFGFRPLLFV